jgi:FAD/FMN-containing dehydrogenase
VQFMLDSAIIEQFRAVVGKNNVLTGKVNLATYSYDATADVPKGSPDIIVLPTSAAQVQSVVNLARENGIAIYPRGAGTNLSGGTIPVEHGIVLSMQKMDKILEVDSENLTATVQPGVVIQDLNKVAQEAEAVVKVVTQNNGELRVANSDVERDKVWAARRAALPALAALNNTVVLEDATVPRSRITDMLLALSEIGRKYNLVLGTFGHAGDGNLHPTILADKNNLDEMARVHKAVDEIFETALKFGGTLSGEHGIGIAKMKYLGNEIGESGLDLMRSIKNALDPTHMLNPGKLVPIKPIQEVAHATR